MGMCDRGKANCGARIPIGIAMHCPRPFRGGVGCEWTERLEAGRNSETPHFGL